MTPMSKLEPEMLIEEYRKMLHRPMIWRVVRGPDEAVCRPVWMKMLNNQLP